MATTVYIVAAPIIHTATHGGITKNWRLANLYAVVASIWLGMSPYKWRHKHYKHHNETMNENDGDIAHYPVTRLHPDEKTLWFHKYQHIYVPMYLPFLHISYIIGDILFTLKGSFQARFEQASAIIITTLFLILFIVIPTRVFGIKRALVLFLIFSISLSIISTTMFTTNHLVEGILYTDQDKQDVAKSQIQGSHNFCTNMDGVKPVVWNYISGGLNHQIEHHLFPSMHYLLYPAIARVIKRFAKENDIAYNTTNDGVTCGYAKSQLMFIKHLRNLGISS